jgi:hypothetical protein
MLSHPIWGESPIAPAASRCYIRVMRDAEIWPEEALAETLPQHQTHPTRCVRVENETEAFSGPWLSACWLSPAK